MSRKMPGLNRNLEMRQAMLGPMNPVALFDLEPMRGIGIRRLRGNGGDGMQARLAGPCVGCPKVHAG